MSQDIVIIGAVALGPKAACRFKRLEPDSKVTMIDQSDIISYGGCGIPYYISGDVSDPGQLQATSFNMLRDVKFFNDAKDIKVLTGTRVVSIDRNKKTVHTIHSKTGDKNILSYDKLVLATGSRPKKLITPGRDLGGVFSISNMDDAVAVKGLISGGSIGKAVIVGAGAIGLEIAEALSDLWGIETTILEIRNQLLPGIIGPNLAYIAQQHMEENGITFHFGEVIQRIEGDKHVEKVITDKREIDTDLVITALGVEPDTELARAADLETSPSGAIIVNEYLQTSDPDIYAGGDCVEIPNLVSGKPGYFPLGSMANRQGRVIGTNLAGGNAKFKGAIGSFIIKLFNISVGSAGLCLETAESNGFDAMSAFIIQFDKAHFYPEKDLMSLELDFEKETGRVLGIQGIGDNGEGMMARIDAVAAILKYRPVLEDISNLELVYSPPFSSAMDILNALANAAENILENKNRVINPDKFYTLWQNRETENTFFLDCRGFGNAEPFVTKYPSDWISIPQDELRARIKEVPRDKKILLICNTGVRSYEAQRILDNVGISDSYNLQGGMAAIKKSGWDI